MPTKKSTTKKAGSAPSPSKKSASTDTKSVAGKKVADKETKVRKLPKAAKTKAVVEPAADTAAPSEEKKVVIEKYQVKEGDTGSPEVQVALLTKRIEKLVGHLKSNPADNHSRRGLLGIVSKRRRLLNYLEKKDSKRYKDIAKKLGLGK